MDINKAGGGAFKTQPYKNLFRDLFDHFFGIGRVGDRNHIATQNVPITNDNP